MPRSSKRDWYEGIRSAFIKRPARLSDFDPRPFLRKLWLAREALKAPDPFEKGISKEERDLRLGEAIMDMVTPMGLMSKADLLRRWLTEAKGAPHYFEVAKDIKAIPQSVWDEVRIFEVKHLPNTAGKWSDITKRLLLTPRARLVTVPHEATHIETTIRGDKIRKTREALAGKLSDMFGHWTQWPEDVYRDFYDYLDPDEHVARLASRRFIEDFREAKKIPAWEWKFLQDTTRREVEPWADKMLHVVTKMKPKDFFRYSQDYWDLLQETKELFGDELF